MDILYAVLNAIRPCWAELIGAFLMAAMINLISIKEAQKDSFGFLSAAFSTIIIRDLLKVAFDMVPIFIPTLYVRDELASYIALVLTALSAALFMVGAMRNMRFYFSPAWLICVLTIALSGVSFVPSTYPFLTLIKTYLPPLYLMLSIFIAGVSFYLNSASRQNKVVRGVGNGLIILSVCYGYQLFDLINNIQQILLLGYTIAIVLSLASQVQFLNIHITQLTDKIEAEKKSKFELWEFSPFPIVISRLRDDVILYMNPTAKRMLSVRDEDVGRYPLSSYFVDPEKKNDLLDLLRQNASVQSFEAQFCPPMKKTVIWISMTTRTTDLDEEVVLFTTFQDITERKHTEEILAEQASTDPLTGLYNRRQFEILAYQALQTARRYETPYSIAMMDIDFFKKVNDTYGHDAGDAVLKNLAQTLQKTLRKSDVIARYGGEEFVIFFAQTAPPEASIAAEHIREAVSQMKTVMGDTEIPITVSIGISDNEIAELPVLIKQADEALYASKENGRNRVTLYRNLPEHNVQTSTESEETSPSTTSSEEMAELVEINTVVEQAIPLEQPVESEQQQNTEASEEVFSPVLPEPPQLPQPQSESVAATTEIIGTDES